MHLNEIKQKLKENSITMAEFKKNLGSFLFRIADNGKIIIDPWDVNNTISRILNERKIIG